MVNSSIMTSVVIEPHFDAWRKAARSLLAQKVQPKDVMWEKAGSQGGLLAFDELLALPLEAPEPRVPRSFLKLAQTVCAHRSGKQWSLLYEVLWEMSHGSDRRVLSNQTDVRIRALERMRATVSRDIHKMRAFVRFRKVASEDESGRENYVAWFEPEHLIVRLNTAFFRKRFGGMNWSILTPDECVHWDGQGITYTDGVDQAAAPDADELEELWRGYYRSIFNPARLKIKMMQSEMPKKYWKNLPEAEIIEELIEMSSGQVHAMMETEGRPLKPEPNNAYLDRLKALDDEAVGDR